MHRVKSVPLRPMPGLLTTKSAQAEADATQGNLSPLFALNIFFGSREKRDKFERLEKRELVK